MYATFLATRPKAFEEAAIRMLLAQLRRVEDAAALVKSQAPPGWGLHIVHLGHGGMLPEIAAAKAQGANPEVRMASSCQAKRIHEAVLESKSLVRLQSEQLHLETVVKERTQPATELIEAGCALRTLRATGRAAGQRPGTISADIQPHQNCKHASCGDPCSAVAAESGYRV